ncbi:MAG: DUF2281 domain-containing protein [Oscillospiraceae bacterium]|nr:DUF2281 domain-containing protein [Oscillospiraceae bacterium]
MIEINEIVHELESLPNEYFQEILDFVGYLKNKRLKNIPEIMLFSENSLSKEWNTPEEDAAWANL